MIGLNRSNPYSYELIRFIKWSKAANKYYTVHVIKFASIYNYNIRHLQGSEYILGALDWFLKNTSRNSDSRPVHIGSTRVDRPYL